jgi:hypothetical protein
MEQYRADLSDRAQALREPVLVGDLFPNHGHTRRYRATQHLVYLHRARYWAAREFGGDIADRVVGGAYRLARLSHLNYYGLDCSQWLASRGWGDAADNETNVGLLHKGTVERLAHQWDFARQTDVHWFDAIGASLNVNRRVSLVPGRVYAATRDSLLTDYSQYEGVIVDLRTNARTRSNPSSIVPDLTRPLPPRKKPSRKIPALVDCTPGQYVPEYIDRAA